MSLTEFGEIWKIGRGKLWVIKGKIWGIIVNFINYLGFYK